MAGEVAFWRREVRLPAWPSAAMGAVAGLALLVVLQFHECVLSGRVLYEWDIHLFWHSQVEGFVRTVAAGALPLWNSAVAFGRPMLADANYQVLYPPTWLHLILPPPAVHLSLLVTHCLFSGIGMLLLGRRLGASRLAAWTAAAMWLASGPLLSLVYVWNHFTAACWIPWALLAADRVRVNGGGNDRLLWGACLAAPVLAGSPDVAVYLALASGVYVLRGTRWQRPWTSRHLAPLLSAGVAATLALGLSAGQWLPSLELARHSPRARLSSEVRTYWSVHPLMLAQTLAPVFPNALPLTPADRALVFESREPFLKSLYLGLPALGLVVAALVRGAGPARAFAVLGTAFAAWALGHHTPLHGLFSFLIFPLRLLRYPEKAMVLVAFCWCLVAGLGLDAWRRREPEPRRWARQCLLAAFALPALLALALALWTLSGPAWLSRHLLVPMAPAELLALPASRMGWAALAGGCAVLLFLLRTRLADRLAAPLLAVLVISDLAWTNRTANPSGPKEIYSTPSSLARLRGDEPTRVYVYDYLVGRKSEQYLGRPDPYRIVRLPPGWNSNQARALAMRLSLFPPSAQVWGIEGSFDVDILDLYPPWLSSLVAGLRSAEGQPAHLRLLRLGAVQYVVALHRAGLEDLEPEAVLPSFFPEPLQVFRVADPLPRCYAVSGARVADGQSALTLLGDEVFAPRLEVLLAAGVAVPADSAFTGEAHILERRPDRVRIGATLSRPGFVVLLDGYDEGWHASVDGQPAEVLRANLAFRAVKVAAGRHVVEQTYRPRAATLGLLLSATTLSGAALWFAMRRRRTRLAPGSS